MAEQQLSENESSTSYWRLKRPDASSKHCFFRVKRHGEYFAVAERLHVVALDGGGIGFMHVIAADEKNAREVSCSYNFPIGLSQEKFNMISEGIFESISHDQFEMEKKAVLDFYLKANVRC